MQTFNAIFRAWNDSPHKERRFAISIDMGGGSVIWTVSHPDVTPGTGTVLAAEISSLSVLSQTLHPDEGRAEIGTMSWSATDIEQSLSDELQDELLFSFRGVMGKTARLYVGDARMAFGDYELRATQLVDRITVDQAGTRYNFRCRDVQRLLRTDIFEPVESTLTAPISATDTTIPVISSALFVGVDHGTSWSDAPSTDGAIYIRIDDEIIRCSAASKTATTWTNVVRGVLGTRAAAHDTDATASTNPDAGTKVTEVVYLELPVPKLIGAVLTGTLWNQGGDTLPAHWHAGVPSAFVSEAEHEAIGLDIWDPSDDTKGVVLRFLEPGQRDAKQFVEQDILAPLGMFQPVRADGSLGLRRASRIVEGTAVVRTLGNADLMAAPELEYDGTKIINDVEVGWNFIDGEPTRSVALVNSGSVARWGAQPRRKYTAPGLHGSVHSRDVVVDLIQQIFDRYSGPPITTTIKVGGRHADLEVGDVVQVVTSSARDWTGATISLNRAFEVQGMREDWVRNSITLQLFASSEASDVLEPLSNDTGIDDAWFTSAGTNLASIGGVVDLGSRLELQSNASITGNANLTASGAVFYAGKPFTIAAGMTLTIHSNVQLRVLGTMTINGQINGTGNGLAGVPDTVDENPIPFYPTVLGPVSFAIQGGNAGGFGTTHAGGGIIERMRRENVGSGHNGVIQSINAPLTRGTWDVLPAFDLRWNGSTVIGLPADLRGSSGGPGGLRYYSDTKPAPNVEQVNRGGTGGDGGAGIAIIARGIAFGASGKIITDGDDGALGAYAAGNDQPAHAGAGAGGAPGAQLLVVDGLLNSVPTALASQSQAIYGDVPLPATFNRLTEPVYLEKVQFGTEFPISRLSFYPSTASGRDAGFAAVRVQFMPPLSDPAEDFDLANRAVPAATALIVTPAERGNLIRWTLPEDLDSWDRAEVYASPTNAWADSVLVGTTDSDFLFHDLDAFVTRGYWVVMKRGSRSSLRLPDSATTTFIGTSLPIGAGDVEYGGAALFDSLSAETLGMNVSSLRNWDMHRVAGATVDVVEDVSSPFGAKTIVANGEVWLRSKRSVAYDPTRMHRLTAYLRRSNTITGNCYVGLLAEKTDGSWVDTVGAASIYNAHYTSNGISNADLPTSWKGFTGHVNGVGASGTNATSTLDGSPVNDPIRMIDTTARVRLVVLLNNNSGSGVPNTEQTRLAGIVLTQIEAAFTATTDPRLAPVANDLLNAAQVVPSANPAEKVWVSDSGGVFPGGNPTQILTAYFHRLGTLIATHPVQVNLNSASGTITHTTQTTSGEATTLSVTGSGTAVMRLEVKHTASNQLQVLHASAVNATVPGITK